MELTRGLRKRLFGPKAQQEHTVNESEQLISHPYGAVAIQSFQPEDEAELGFEEGDRLLIFNVEERGWLSALRVDLDAGAEGMPYGYVPETFVRREELMPAVALEQFVARDDSQLSLEHGEIVGVLGEPPAGRGWAVVFKGEGSEEPHGPGIVPREYLHPSTLAITTANFKAQSGMEIDLQKGQHVWALPFEVGHGWVEVIACATGAHGVVPVGYLQEKKPAPAKVRSPSVKPSNAAKPISQADEGTAAADAMQAAFREVEAAKEKAARETEAARELAAREAEAAKAKAAQEAEEAKARVWAIYHGKGNGKDHGKGKGKGAEEAHRLLSEALLRGSNAGVLWRHARLMVRGVGGAGKSSTIDAMAGKEFDAAHKSTVGAGFEELELVRQDLALGGTGGALRRYERPSGEGEYALAVAAHAASLVHPSAAAPEGTSMLGAIEKPRPRVPKAVAPASSSGGAPATTQGGGGGSRPMRIASAPRSEGGAAVGGGTRSEARAPSPALAEGAASDGGQDGTPLVDEKPPQREAPPAVSPELVIKFQKGQVQSNLVLRVQDTGGQPVFLSILELLTTPASTVYMVVFSLPKLSEDFDASLQSMTAQLKSIQVFAVGAPVILAGTRRDEVSGGEAELGRLNDRLLEALQKQCAPAIAGLERDPKTGRCFFGVENSKGFVGDEMIRELVKAVEGAALKLPSMNQRVPLEWLRVHDELRKLGQEQRRVRLDAVRAIASRHGLPHEGFSLDDELSAMLTFFHSLNSILWYNAPNLRDLVVLDPQWIIDAVTCFVRDFELQDHTVGHRMHTLDQRAKREEPNAWNLLTRGQATLQRKLLNILWSGDEFKEHKHELLDLMTRFHLAVPVTKKSDEWIIPALLVDRPHASPPSAWPSLPADAAELRIHFAIEGVHQDSQLLMGTHTLSAGFMPNAVFTHICCGAYASSESSKFGVSLERSIAYVVFDKELVTLRCLPAESCIHVSLYSNGKSCGSIVIDRLRTLVSEALAEYRNLRSCILAPLAGSSEVWVAIDMLTQMGSGAADVHTPDGRKISVSRLKEELSLWLTSQCEFNFILAEKLRQAGRDGFPKMLRLQDMREKHPDWVVRRTINFEQACLGAYTREYLAVSHRWEERTEPDIKGAQLESLLALLNKRKEIQYVFYDLMSLPQGADKMPAEQAEFGQQLPNINLLFLGCWVLILLDRSYTSRFWTLYEAWLAFMMATSDGLLPAPEAKRRCTIMCLHNTPSSYQRGLHEEFEDATAHSTYEKLSSPDVTVTNMSDKEMQLPKILIMNQMVIELMAKSKDASRANLLSVLLDSSANFLDRLALAEARDSSREHLSSAARRKGAATDSNRKAFAAGSVAKAVKASAVMGGDAGGVAGLAELLEGCQLQEKLAAATAWCEEQGVDSVGMLRDDVDEEDREAFVVCLKLKPLKAKQLLKKLKGEA